MLDREALRMAREMFDSADAASAAEFNPPAGPAKKRNF
jgi:hypothetical protein